MKLNVPIKVEADDELRRIGGHWNDDKLIWEIPDGKPYVDFHKYIPLNIEVMPVTTWKSEYEGVIPEEEMTVIKKGVYSQSECKCEICEGQGEEWPVEVHEIWDYVYKAKLQILKGFEALCPTCHKVKHLISSGRYEDAMSVEPELIKHFCKINECTKDEYVKYFNEVKKKREEESAYLWIADISHLLMMSKRHPYASEYYSGEEFVKLMKEIKQYALCEENLLPDERLQKKLIGYAEGQLANNKEIKGNTALRAGLLLNIMKRNKK